MAIHLEKIKEGVFVYTWEGKITAEEIRQSMVPQLYEARRVVFDASQLDYHPFELAELGNNSHRKIENLEHVYVVYKPLFQTSIKSLVEDTLRAPYSLHLSREEAIQRASAD